MGRLRADTAWRASLVTMKPLLAFGWTIAGVLLWLGTLVVAYVLPSVDPILFVLGTVFVTALGIGFAVPRILVAADIFRRLRALPGPDLADIPADERAVIPAAMLEPRDGVSVEHLDRMLSGSPNEQPASVAEMNRMNAQAVAINVTTIVAFVVFGLGAVLLLPTGVGRFGDGAAFQLVAIGAIGPVAINACVLWAFREIGFIAIAGRFVAAQKVLDTGVLPDNGSALSVIVRQGARWIVNPRALPARRAPRRRHLAAAHSNKMPAVLAQAWAFVALSPLVALVAISITVARSAG